MLLFTAAALIGTCNAVGAAPGEPELSVTAVSGFREMPVVVEAPGGLAGETTVALRGAGRSVFGQIVTIAGKPHIAAVLRDLKPQESRTYALAPSPGYRPAGMMVTRKDGELIIRRSGREFARHVSANAGKPFVSPIYTSGGIRVTRDVQDPGERTDHPHHRGLWFTHGAVNGVDFWNERPGFGRIAQTSEHYAVGPACTELRTNNDWILPDGSKACTDERTILFWDTAEPRVIDYSVTVKASEGPLTLGDTKEGSFAIRVPIWMTVISGTGHINTSEGIKDAAAWGKRASWVDYFGTVDGKTAGVSIIEDRSNFRFPTYWHARDYGLFAANPFGIAMFTEDSSKDGTVKLDRGESLTLRYRVLIHKGDTAAARTAEWARQMHSAEVSVSR